MRVLVIVCVRYGLLAKCDVLGVIVSLLSLSCISISLQHLDYSLH